ncbi:MAG: PPC domain-containing protein, partial [Thermoanaerobaculia bacterium]
QFAGTAGTTVTIDASSSAFDTVLFLLDPTPNVVALNDDFNSSTDSRIVFTLTSTGTWSIAVNSIGAADFGPYVASLSCTTGGSGCNIAGALSCRSTINGALSTSDCNTGGTTNVYVDFYDFNATAGAPFTVTYSSSAFPLFLTVQEPSAGTVLASQAGSGAISLTYTPTYTGRHVIGIATTQSFATGGYTVSVECGAGAAGCSNSANTLCLSDSRFRVQTSWRVPSQGTSGFGSAVPLTQDSGYFWFFDPGNVELVVKVLNACSFSNFKWVFAAGLTNVEVTMTVTDTRNGMVRTYFNPSGIPYAPIQDTSAFATCP